MKVRSNVVGFVPSELVITFESEVEREEMFALFSSVMVTEAVKSLDHEAIRESIKENGRPEYRNALRVITSKFS